MADKIDDGGPAYPREDYQGGGLGQTGMSLRDYFAAAALQGLTNGAEVFWPATPHVAYQYADAMLAARKQGGDA